MRVVKDLFRLFKSYTIFMAPTNPPRDSKPSEEANSWSAWFQDNLTALRSSLINMTNAKESSKPAAVIPPFQWTLPDSASIYLFSAASFVAGIAASRFFQSHVKRIKTASHLSPERMGQQQRFKALVLNVGDSDNFRAVHLSPYLPGSRWFWRYKIWRGLGRGELTGNTLHIRLAGIDAPEVGLMLIQCSFSPSCEIVERVRNAKTKVQ